MKATFFIPLIGTPVYAIRDTGIQVPFTVQFLQGAWKKNGKNWRLNQSQSCPMYIKSGDVYIRDGKQTSNRLSQQIKQMDIIFGIPPCRFLSMLNVKHDHKALGDSQNCMIDIAKQAARYQPKVFCFQNAPRFSSAKQALQWAIPELMKSLPGYNFTIYKTTTLNHGLPQKRQRTFFLAYKGPHRFFNVYKHKDNPVKIDDLISDLNQQVDQSPYICRSQNKLQRWMRKGCQKITSHQSIQNWFYWKQLMHYCKDPNRSLMWQMTYKGEDYGYNWKKMLRQVKGQKDHQKLKRIFQYAQMKMSKGFGYWDSSPMLASGSHINAIISKNAYRLVHPSKKRLLTLRQLRRFMGVPDRFTFHQKNRSAALHYLTQNVPSFTYADVRQQCKKHVDGFGQYVPTGKPLIYIQNITDPNKDIYYAYTMQQVMRSECGLGRDKRFYVRDHERQHGKPFIERINV